MLSGKSVLVPPYIRRGLLQVSSLHRIPVVDVSTESEGRLTAGPDSIAGGTGHSLLIQSLLLIDAKHRQPTASAGPDGTGRQNGGGNSGVCQRPAGSTPVTSPSYNIRPDLSMPQLLWTSTKIGGRQSPVVSG